MKQAKKLTRAQKKILDKAGLFPHEWMLMNEDTETLQIIHKKSSEIKTINKKGK